MAPRWSTTTKRRFPGMSAKAAIGRPVTAAQVQAAMPPPRSLNASRRVVMPSPSLELRTCDQEREPRALVGSAPDGALDFLGKSLAIGARHDVDGIRHVGEPFG